MAMRVRLGVMPPTEPRGVEAFIGLGANLGDAAAAVRAAMASIANLPDTQVLAASSLYSSAPVGEGAEGPNYVNAVLAVRTQLTALALLAQLQNIENMAGRERPYANAPRTLDLDVLLYGDEEIRTPTLTVPHPRMYERAFVLRPLAQIAPQRISAADLSRVAAQPIFRIAD